MITKDCHFGVSISLEASSTEFYSFPSRDFLREKNIYIIKYSINMILVILSYIEWESFFKNRVNIDPWVATSKNEVWAVSLKPKIYQSHCLNKMTFDLTFSRLPIIYRKSRRQEQEICFLLTLYVFAKMSPSFLLWEEISSPEIY